MSDPQEELRLRLQAVHEAYLAKLPDKLAEIAGLWETLTTAPQEPETLKSLHRHVHSLVGSAGTFGYDEISELARAFERQLRHHLDTESIPDAAALGSMRVSLDALLQAAADPAPSSR